MGSVSKLAFTSLHQQLITGALHRQPLSESATPSAVTAPALQALYVSRGSGLPL